MTNTFRKSLLIFLGLTMLIAGGIAAKKILKKKDAKSPPAAKGREEKPKRPDKFPEAAKPPTQEFSSETARHLAELTDGRRVRLVWVECVSSTNPDIFTRGKNLRLAGFDSQDGGYRRFTEKPGSYSRPILTPDGQNILFTVSPASPAGAPVSWDPRIHLMSWDGKTQQELLPGYALDAIQDPTTKEIWVYALEKLNPHTKLALDGEGMFRFLLSDPTKREMVWNQTSLSTDNLQLSRDGRYFGAQMPWPEGGWGDLTSGLHQKLESGCWTSFAPDNSYLFWIFKGTHKALTLVDTATKKSWQVDVSKTPGFKNQPTYHPRWSNDPRFLTMTGPYPPPRKKKDKRTGKSTVTKNGVQAEIYFGKFSEKMDAVENWVRITNNSYGDFYPDAWIEGGEAAVLAVFPQSQGLKISKKNPDDWPPNVTDLLYVWGNAGTSNEIAGRHGSCQAMGHGIGRFDRGREMLLDGGWFGTEPATTEVLAKSLPTATSLSLEFLFAESAVLPADATVRLVSLEDASGQPYFEMIRSHDALTFSSPAGKLGTEALELRAPLVHIGPQETHLVFQITPEHLVWFHKGAEIASSPLSAPPQFQNLRDAHLIFGQAKPVPADWRAQLQNVALYRRAASEVDLVAMRKASKASATPPALRIRLRAKLLEATEPDMDMLASYQRMLVDHTYEVQEVLEGSLAASKILVLHWAVLDRKPVPGIPREVGDVYELTLESLEAHPELESELQMNGSEDLSLGLYMDTSTPANPE